MVTHIPTISCSMTSVLEPAQLMAESVICRGMLYSPSRTTVVVLVEMKWSGVLVSILYSSTTSPDSSSSSQEIMMEKVPVLKFLVSSMISVGVDGGSGKVMQGITHNIASITIFFPFVCPDSMVCLHFSN